MCQGAQFTGITRLRNVEVKLTAVVHSSIEYVVAEKLMAFAEV